MRCLLDKPGLHLYKCETSAPFDRVPSHLAFDHVFLQFLHGVRMFPHHDRDKMLHLTPEDLFPLNLPAAEMRCLLAREYDDGRWGCIYECTCHRPRSLQCSAMASVVIQHWHAEIRRYLEEAETRDPLPHLPIRGFKAMHYGKHPLSALHVLLELVTVRPNFHLQLQPDGYVLHIHPPYVNHRLVQTIRWLTHYKALLSFNLKVVCYPYYSVD